MDSQKMKMMYLVVVLVAFFINRWLRTPSIPEQFLNRKHVYIPEFIGEETAKRLMERIKGYKEFFLDDEYLKHSAGASLNPDEAQMAKNRKCDDSYLILNENSTICGYTSRYDVTRHYLKFGGLEGLKAGPERALSKIQSYVYRLPCGADLVDLVDLIQLPTLIESERSICPGLKMSMGDLNAKIRIQIPGTGEPIHLDEIHFRDERHEHLPLWLKTIMAHSTTFKNSERKEKMEVLVHLNKEHFEQEGRVFIYNKNDLKPIYYEAAPRSALLRESSASYHGRTFYFIGAKTPDIGATRNSKLIFTGDDNWELHNDGVPVRRYKTNALLISLELSASCVGNEGEDDKNIISHSTNEDMDKENIAHVLEELKAELSNTGVFEKQYLDELSHHALTKILIDEIVKYPVPPHALIPFNYCMFFSRLPQSLPFMNKLC